MEKCCSKCKEFKSTDQFYKGSTKSGYKDGLQPWCKTCLRVYAKQREQGTYKQRRRALRLKRQYGLTVEQYVALLSKQNNLCASCSNELSDTQFTHVDHDHTTGRVRALLCHRCNVCLGQFGEDGDLIRKLATYADGC